MVRKGRQRARAGEGTVFQRGDGKWVASVSRGSRENRKRDVRVCGSESAALEALRKLRSEAAMPFRSGDPPPLLTDYMKTWLADTKHRVRAKTYVTYELVVRLHISKHIGAMRIDRIKPQNVRDLFAQLEQLGVSPRVRQLAYLRLRTALGAAVGTAIAANPVLPAHRPRVERRTMKVWSAEEARHFLEATADDRLSALYRLALSVGMRQGELLALRWVDVDVKHRRLSIQHTLTDAGELAEAKTKGSRRTIELPARAAAAIAEQRARTQTEAEAIEDRAIAKALARSEFVFPGKRGLPQRGQTVEDAFQRAAKAAGLPRIRFHDLRHTSATLMLAAGVSVKSVSSILGHASAAMTLDVYSHFTPSMGREAADRVDAIL